MKDNLLKKFFSFSYGSWIGLIIGFLTTIITTRVLSPEDFGKASMFTLAINIFMIFIIFGTDQSFVRFFYEEKESNRGGLLYNSLKIPIFILVITISIIFIYHSKITLFLFNENNKLITGMLIIGIITQVIYRYGTLVIRMKQKGNLFSLIEILNKALNLVFFFLFYSIIGANYKVIIYALILTLLILIIIPIISEREYWKPGNFFNKDTIHKKREIIKYGSPLVLTTLISWLFQSFDRIAIKQWSDLQELGLYAAAFKIVALLSILQVTFSNFWAPVAYQKYEETPEDKKFFSNISKLVSFSMFFIAVLTIACKDIIVILLGKEYRSASDIMPFLVFMPIMYTLSETTVIGINFIKKPKWHILIAGISCFVNILGNWIFVPRYGALGASISTALSYIVFFILRTHISLKYYKVDYAMNKIYTMLIVISLYATYSLVITNFYLNLLSSSIVMIILISIYYKELIEGYKDIIIKRRKSI